MKIMLMDGREFQGTPLQIVRSMQALAFAAVDYTLPKYVEWVAGNALKYPVVELVVKGATDDELAAALVSEMLRTGLARNV